MADAGRARRHGGHRGSRSIVVAVREDASVAVSDQFAFNADGTVVRVVARVDVGVNDRTGFA